MYSKTRRDRRKRIIKMKLHDSASDCAHHPRLHPIEDKFEVIFAFDFFNLVPYAIPYFMKRR